MTQQKHPNPTEFPQFSAEGEATVKAPDIDLLCEIELARAQAAENMKAEGVLLYTLVEVNVTRPIHKMLGGALEHFSFMFPRLILEI